MIWPDFREENPQVSFINGYVCRLLAEELSLETISFQMLYSFASAPIRVDQVKVISNGVEHLKQRTAHHHFVVPNKYRRYISAQYNPACSAIQQPALDELGTQYFVVHTLPHGAGECIRASTSITDEIVPDEPSARSQHTVRKDPSS